MTENNTWWRRLWREIVPAMPDFQAMLEAQADNLHATMATLADYLVTCDPTLALRVHALVDEGHTLRDRNLGQLHHSFITPIDREDIYTLAMSIDHILDYVKNTVREVEVLQVESDDWMRHMTAELTKGVASLALGLAQFRAGHAEEVAQTVQTRDAERSIEDLYRDALQDMFNGEEYLSLTAGNQPPSVLACLDFVVSRIKRREVYRHISNAADRLARAGEALRDIGIKYDKGGSGSRRQDE
jgi:uncharacterized protein Yka (UPF0111/DUF47 family)